MYNRRRRICAIYVSVCTPFATERIPHLTTSEPIAQCSLPLNWIEPSTTLYMYTVYANMRFMSIPILQIIFLFLSCLSTQKLLDNLFARGTHIQSTGLHTRCFVCCTCRPTLLTVACCYTHIHTYTVSYRTVLYRTVWYWRRARWGRPGRKSREGRGGQ